MKTVKHKHTVIFLYLFMDKKRKRKITKGNASSLNWARVSTHVQTNLHINTIKIIKIKPLLKASRPRTVNHRPPSASPSSPSLLPRLCSIAAAGCKSTIYSPRSEFVIVLMIFTQIRIYRVDIEDSGSLETLLS